MSSKRLKRYYLRQQLSAGEKVKLEMSTSGCEEVLQDLNNLLAKYESLGTKSQRTFDRLGFGTRDLNGIRTRLILNVTLLDAFNNISSHARLEAKLDILVSEISAGKREGSVVSAKTVDSIAQNEHAAWDELRRELEDVGISVVVITEKRQFIIAWFQAAVAAGRLEDDFSGANPDSDRDSSTNEQDESDLVVRNNRSDELLAPSTAPRASELDTADGRRLWWSRQNYTF